ncbi:MAG: hypothetical protein KJ626_04500 [Verrucomicrobia bacterium]|nr:hypothetical protein [Verrucomicrobiota bacterium]
MTGKSFSGDTPLPEEAAWLLQKADGYLDLHMPDHTRALLAEADNEWKQFAPFKQVELRLAIESGDWVLAAGLARDLRDKTPDEIAYWVQFAYALRRLKSIEDARGVLLEAIEKFPEEPVIPFNLACYECQLGRLHEAFSYLQKAVTLNPRYLQRALRDHDLEPIWEDLS